MKRLFYKFLWSIPIILFALITLQIFTNKKIDLKPLKNEKGLIEGTGIHINLFNNNIIHTTINASWAQVHDIPHNDNVAIICKDKVNYNEHKRLNVSASYAELTLERKDKTNYSINSDNIISVLFEEAVRIKTDNDTVKTDQAQYLVKQKIIFGNKKLVIQSNNGYLLQSAKGFNWDLKKNVINLYGKTTGEFLVQ